MRAGARRASRAPLDDPRPRQVQRAVAAGLQELRTHTDPRQAIIACYARLEHLLTDYGVPAYEHLTPQEYMGTALQDLDLPTDAFAGLVALFELARYSLHPLDDTARRTAMAYLEQLQTHLNRTTRMRHMSEPLTPSARFLHDAGILALLALVLIPLYLLLNHYWQSLILLVIFYGLLCPLLYPPGQVYTPCHAAPASRNPAVAHSPDGRGIASRTGETF